MANNLFRTDLEELGIEINELYCSEAVDTEVMEQTELGIAFIRIENYMSELEKTIEQLKNQIK
jgi:hypothetical protein